jgi:hypothetical protein
MKVHSKRKNPNDYYVRTTIRILKEKEWVLPRFKKIVTEDLHSDQCYVETWLHEAFVTAFEQAPNPEDPLVLKLLRQNIQINIACNLNYNVRKGRRQPPGINKDPLTMPRMELNKNRFFPLLLEEWDTLSAAQKDFWLQRLQESGIIPIAAQKKDDQKNTDSMEQSMLIGIKPVLWRFLVWMVTPLCATCAPNSDDSEDYPEPGEDS